MASGMTPAKRFLVRTSLITGSTLATILGAQSLAALDLQASTVDVADEQTSADTIVIIVPNEETVSDVTTVATLVPTVTETATQVASTSTEVAATATEVAPTATEVAPTATTVPTATATTVPTTTTQTQLRTRSSR